MSETVTVFVVVQDMDTRHGASAVGVYDAEDKAHAEVKRLEEEKAERNFYKYDVCWHVAELEMNEGR